MVMSSVIKKITGWANLPDEQLRDGIKRLKEEESESKHVKTPEFSSKLTFPVSFKQPGPKDGTIQCIIKRDKSNMTYRLYLSLTPDSLVESGKFLLSAKRTKIIPHKEYVISMDANNISRSSTTYIGKLRSNFQGTKFEIYDTESKPNQKSPTRWFKSNKVSPKEVRSYNNIAQVTYDLNVKTCGPRKIHCINHSKPDSQEEGQLVLRNKLPRWHKKLKCWCLTFKGRVTVASVKNFQLLAVETASSQEKLGETDDGEKIILQFGKVDKDVFTMDYGYPLSAFQAFAICLTSFDAKLVCE